MGDAKKEARALVLGAGLFSIESFVKTSGWTEETGFTDALMHWAGTTWGHHPRAFGFGVLSRVLCNILEELPSNLMDVSRTLVIIVPIIAHYALPCCPPASFAALLP